MATAQKEPSLVQKGLLASKLARLNSDLPEAARPKSEVLCTVAKCQLCEIARAEPDFQLYTARPRPGRPDRSDLNLPEAEEWCEAPRLRPGGPDRSELPLSKTGWLWDTATELPAEDQLYQARPRLNKPDRLEAKLVLCNTARATRRVNAPSPLGTRGQ